MKGHTEQIGGIKILDDGRTFPGQRTEHCAYGMASPNTPK